MVQKYPQVLINAKVAYTSIYNNVIGNFNRNSSLIEPNQEMSFELTLDGTISKSQNQIIKVGTIDLTISEGDL